MKRLPSVALGGLIAVAGGLTPLDTRAVNFADAVISYTSGTGFAPGFINPATALGAPTTSLDYQPFVDPFNPPYATSNLVSIGAGGSLTLGFSTPILNAAGNLFSLDLILYGNDGFVDTNYPNGVTDGSLFSSAFGTPGTSTVWASADGVSFFELRPPSGVSARVDTLFPTDSLGAFGMPANPAMTNVDFAGLNLAGIRSQYNGSAGGTGFDLAWAVDANGNAVALSSASFVRVDVSASKVEIDSIAATVPEPGTEALLLAGGVAVAGALRRRRR